MQNKISDQLKTILYPGFSKSIVDFGFVKNIQLNQESVTILLEITSSANEVEEILRKEIKSKLQTIGVKTINLEIIKPEEPKQKSNTVSNKNIAPKIKNFIMVSSGKGGVGKSTTTVNLALALAIQGKKVGILDADIYGPNIPRMMGVHATEPEIVDSKIKPFRNFGIDIMSMGLLLQEGQALIWRGAMIMKAIEQLLRDVLWEELDVLLIDMPPGTGDAQLTLAQSVPVTAGINVTTPQHVALDDSKRSLDMFTKLHIPIAGIIENMSGFICPSCQTESLIFSKGTCEKLAQEYNTQVLANMPLEPAIREGSDSGKPIVYFNPSSVTAKRYLEAADKLWNEIEKINLDGKVSNAAIQPTTQEAACGSSNTASKNNDGKHDGCNCL